MREREAAWRERRSQMFWWNDLEEFTGSEEVSGLTLAFIQLSMQCVCPILRCQESLYHTGCFFAH